MKIPPVANSITNAEYKQCINYKIKHTCTEAGFVHAANIKNN